MKNIPNLFTLLNLIFGCIAIVFILQTGESIIIMENTGATQVYMPEKIYWGALFIFGAAVIDFLDGFFARMLKASSEMGKQLDSLSDVVSFGVAPGLILYQLLRISYGQEPNGLEVPMFALLPAFIFTGAVAWRLAKFNIANNQSCNFKGLPSPAAGLLIASFPLIIYYEYFNIQSLFISKWFLYVVIFILSYLMVSNHNFLAIKFIGLSFKKNSLKYVLIILSLAIIIACMLLNALWFAVPVIFLLYLIISIFLPKTESADPQRQPEVITLE
jgi:CDP-diacylglycerol--serine O-phosphatidyltransferase